MISKIKKHSNKIIPSIITLIVIGLILLAGPAKALTLNLDSFSDHDPWSGETITSTFTIEINSNERIQMNPINIYVDNSLYCSFNADGSSSDCTSNGIDIDLISNSNEYGYGYGYSYGYGYGYGYSQGYSNGEFTYQLSIHTNYFSTGTHEIYLSTELSSENIYESNTESITIHKHTSSGSSSIGSTTETENIEEDTFTPISQEITPEEEKEDENNFTSFLTGAVTGVGKFVSSGAGIAVLTALILTLIGTITFVNIRKKFSKK